MSDLIENLNPRRLRYYLVFAVVLIVIVIAESRLTWLFAERILLPHFHPSIEKLHFVDNKGTLSNGEKLVGWRYQIFFLIEGAAWATLALGSTIALAYFWPKTRPKE
jgi:hypothetical protein